MTVRKQDQQKRRRAEIECVLADILSNPHVEEMKRYVQHGSVSTYSHCERVAEASYRIDRTLHLHSNLDTLLKGAMLHDFFLYDWHTGDGSHDLHGFTHAEKACANAKRYFDINRDIYRVIFCHMWPLNLSRIPKSREAWIVCIADKYVSLLETVFGRSSGR